MRKLSPTGMKILKIIHILCSVCWAGGALAMMLLLAYLPEDYADGRYAYSLALKQIDDWLIIGGANGCVLTGLIYGVWTKWGFFRHRWITVKWLLTAFMVLTGTFIMGPCVNGNAAQGNDLAFYLDSDFARNITTIVQWGILQIGLLLIVFAISIVKPWQHRKKP